MPRARCRLSEKALAPAHISPSQTYSCMPTLFLVRTVPLTRPRFPAPSLSATAPSAPRAVTLCSPRHHLLVPELPPWTPRAAAACAGHGGRPALSRAASSLHAVTAPPSARRVPSPRPRLPFSPVAVRSCWPLSSPLASMPLLRPAAAAPKPSARPTGKR